jgi:hypothetical protein
MSHKSLKQVTHNKHHNKPWYSNQLILGDVEGITSLNYRRIQILQRCCTKHFRSGYMLIEIKCHCINAINAYCMDNFRYTLQNFKYTP